MIKIFSPKNDVQPTGFFPLCRETFRDNGPLLNCLILLASAVWPLAFIGVGGIYFAKLKCSPIPATIPKRQFL
jgi:hypothetical protein